jgi:carbamoyltransferase
MNILGVSFGFHDSAAALVVDGKLKAAVAEERISRKKHDSSFPIHAIQAVLDCEGLTSSDIDEVAYHENKYLKANRILLSSIKNGIGGYNFLRNAAKTWIREDKFFPEKTIANTLGVSIKKVKTCEHHQAHAASAFFCSPFEKATVVTLDGIGERETLTISIGEGCKIKKVSATQFPYSIGLVYSAFTSYLGFKVNGGEYKVMGMAGFGRPKYKDEIEKIFKISSKGILKTNNAHFNFETPESVSFNPSMLSWLGENRKPESPFDENMISEDNLRYADIAASIQKVTEDVIVDVIKQAVYLTGQPRVCLAGGVALNSLANAKIQKKLDIELYVQPAAGDDGCALGAALFRTHQKHNKKRYVLKHCLWGRSYDDEEIKKVFADAGIEDYYTADSDLELVQIIADKIANGKVIGWFQGREEWGPRALGNRSILANPMLKSMKSIVNEMVKFREPFRPFAPSVIAENVPEFFEVNMNIRQHSPESFMLAVVKAKEHIKKRCQRSFMLTVPAEFRQSIKKTILYIIN